MFWFCCSLVRSVWAGGTDSECSETVSSGGVSIWMTSCTVLSSRCGSNEMHLGGVTHNSPVGGLM